MSQIKRLFLVFWRLPRANPCITKTSNATYAMIDRRSNLWRADWHSIWRWDPDWRIVQKQIRGRRAVDPQEPTSPHKVTEKRLKGVRTCEPTMQQISMHFLATHMFKVYFKVRDRWRPAQTCTFTMGKTLDVGNVVSIAVIDSSNADLRSSLTLT